MRICWLAILIVTVVVAGIFPAAQAKEEHDHEAMMKEEHDHKAMMMKAPMDELGRRLHGHKHVVDDAVGDELRAKIGPWKEMSNAQLTMNMQMMGSNYEWYISGPDVKEKIGVLILAHGFRDKGDADYKNTVQSVGEVFPTAIAFGMSMAMSRHIQLAVDDLVAAGAEKIVVIPATSASENDMMRQWEYIFGQRDVADYAAVPQVKTDAKIYFRSAPDDDPLVAEILMDYADSVSTDPSNELVIIASHGPTLPEDNEHNLKVLANLAKMVQEDGGYSEVIGVTLQDDALPEVRAANVEKIRKKIEAGKAAGKDVIVVTNLMSTRGIQAKLRKDLKGLDYKFVRKSLTQHDNFMVWLKGNIDDALKGL